MEIRNRNYFDNGVRNEMEIKAKNMELEMELEIISVMVKVYASILCKVLQ